MSRSVDSRKVLGVRGGLEARDAEEQGVGEGEELEVRVVEELGMRGAPIWTWSCVCEEWI